MTVALVCFSSGFLLSALGAAVEQYWLIVLGYGFVGGIGLGIGYISPVSTLIKWFPDRPGMATGIAIMGFGGGALIASPWSAQMLESFGTDNSGIALAFLVHGLTYAVFMLLCRARRSGRTAGRWRSTASRSRRGVPCAPLSSGCSGSCSA
jgi:MFS family permease